MNRYDENTVVKDDSGKRYYESSLLPEIKVTDDDDYIVVAQQKRLDSIAYDYYEDASLWWVIALANNLPPSLYAPIGIQLRIPKDINQYTVNFRELNNG